MAIMVLRTCEQVEGGLPSHISSKMWFNIILDFGIGITPFVGDILDALFRANTRNAVVLEKYLREKGAKALKAQGQRGPTVDPSDPAEFDRHEAEGLPPPYTAGPPTQQGIQTQDDRLRPQTQAPVVMQAERGGWFNGFGKKKKQPDVEGGTSSARRDEPLPSRPDDGSH